MQLNQIFRYGCGGFWDKEENIMKRKEVLYILAEGISEYCARRENCVGCKFRGDDNECIFAVNPAEWTEGQLDEEWFEGWIK